ncbi:hypothetical protein [Streptomyces sp. NPDC048590]|uniref:hypothetical protein n=1 Tax=Streptomyces sp. NPDC048590 TaxID=3365574 RepID=UPI003721191B
MTMPVLTSVGVASKESIMPLSEIGRAATFTDIRTWPRKMAIKGVQDALGS